MNILVIEDTPVSMRLVSGILEREGYTVLQAETAEIGLQIAQQDKPDLIFMDIQLPKMDGLTATRLLKANEDLKHIPIIALTAHAMRDDKANILAAGCDDYIAMPIRYKSFLEIVKSYCTANLEKKDSV